MPGGTPGVSFDARTYEIVRTMRFLAARMLPATTIPVIINIEQDIARFQAGTRTCPGGMIWSMFSFSVVAPVTLVFVVSFESGSGIVQAFHIMSTADVLTCRLICEFEKHYQGENVRDHNVYRDENQSPPSPRRRCLFVNFNSILRDTHELRLWPAPC